MSQSYCLVTLGPYPRLSDSSYYTEADLNQQKDVSVSSGCSDLSEHVQGQSSLLQRNQCQQEQGFDKLRW